MMRPLFEIIRLRLHAVVLYRDVDLLDEINVPQQQSVSRLIGSFKIDLSPFALKIVSFFFFSIYLFFSQEKNN